MTYTKRDKAGLLTLVTNNDATNLAKSCTTGVTDMSGLFSGRNSGTTLNPDLSSWDTGAVMSMRAMFSGAGSFNKAIGTWNTAQGTKMRYTFYDVLDAQSFNRDISSWDVASVTQCSLFTRDYSRLAQTSPPRPNFTNCAPN